MFCGITSLASGWKPESVGARLFRRILWFVPRAFPDNDKKFHLVHSWLVECEDDGRVNREIALSRDGAPLFAAPDDRNFSFWSDCGMIFARADLRVVEASEFERLWSIATAARRSTK